MGLKDILRRHKADSEAQGADFAEGDDFVLPEAKGEPGTVEDEKAVGEHAADA